MCDTIRKCDVCKQQIPITRNNIHGIAKLKTLFYHTECLTEWAQDRVQRKGHARHWEFALANMAACEEDARKAIERRFVQDDFHMYLLKTYDVIDIDLRFWTVVNLLEQGEYRKRKCNPVSMETLFGAWKWGQEKLDKIDRNNKMKHTGPQTGMERINYDLAVLINKVPIYLKEKAKREVEAAEVIIQNQNDIKIDYSTIKANKKSDGLGDISDLLDELI